MNSSILCSLKKKELQIFLIVSCAYVLDDACLFLISPFPYFVCYVHAGTAGFLSIDCGLTGSGYKDTYTGIDYVPDGPYVDSGENHEVAAEYKQHALQRYNTLRSFPSGERNCYALPTAAGAKYLVRMETIYGNYDGRNISSSSGTDYTFDLYLGADYWETVKVGRNVANEAIFVAWASWTPACLVNIGQGTPFVSVVELRPLGDALYPTVTRGMSMNNYYRTMMGANTSFTRYVWPWQYESCMSSYQSASCENIYLNYSYYRP